MDNAGACYENEKINQYMFRFISICLLLMMKDINPIAYERKVKDRSLALILRATLMLRAYVCHEKTSKKAGSRKS